MRQPLGRTRILSRRSRLACWAAILRVIHKQEIPDLGFVANSQNMQHTGHRGELRFELFDAFSPVGAGYKTISI